ncbi:MAG: NAD(P)/FAD-dependent oxidoreductase [Sandaracinaceae bacterium]|nr:NAD(P)/FAD-dependent oxidoreductase [Sandaracinaceae bacterium]
MTGQHYDVLIAGGGSAGITVGARLAQCGKPLRIAIIEPSEYHYYQPLWTLVGAGIFPKEASRRPTAEYIPPGVDWIRDKVVEFQPEKNSVRLESGGNVSYDQLVVALGIQCNWNAIDGLEATLGKDGVSSNYRYDLAELTYRFLNEFRGGNAIFTFPSTPIKCAGAPQKIAYLADEIFRRNGVREKTNLIYASSQKSIFGVAKYAASLSKIVERKKIQTHFRYNLVAVRPKSKEAVFRHLDKGDEMILKYDFLHVVPPQSAPDVVRQSPLANAEGWVDVDKYTLQHVRYPNVFSLGDVSSLPTSRTGAAIRKEAPVLVENLLAYREGRPLTARYDGYASCPLVTGFGKLILAEFDYDGKPAETFPFDQSQERYSMYVLKLYVLPELYWHGMLRGRA